MLCITSAPCLCPSSEPILVLTVFWIAQSTAGYIIVQNTPAPPCWLLFCLLVYISKPPSHVLQSRYDCCLPAAVLSGMQDHYLSLTGFASYPTSGPSLNQNCLSFPHCTGRTRDEGSWEDSWNYDQRMSSWILVFHWFFMCFSCFFIVFQGCSRFFEGI